MAVALSLGAFPGFAQAAGEPPATTAEPPAAAAEPSATTAESTPSPTLDALPAVALEDCVAAARAGGPALKLAGIAASTARAILDLARAEAGVNLGESVDYFHSAKLPGFSNSSTGPSTGASGRSGVNGENFQGALSLAGPATSLDLTAQHGIQEGASIGQVSSLNLSGSQTVYDGYPGGRAAGAVQQAEAAYRVAQIVEQGVTKSVVYQVKQAYYVLLGDQDTVLLRQATSSQAAENFALYHGLFTAQRATRLEVLQMEVALTQAQLDVRSAENAVVTDRKKLSLAVGWPLDRQYRVANNPPPDQPTLTTGDALKSAFQNRSELLTLEQNVAAADIALLLQKSTHQPVVSLNASVGVSRDWAANVNTGSFTAGVSVALPPIYDGGKQDAQVRQAADQVAAYKVQQAQQGQSITIDVENALLSVSDARDRNALATQNLQQAQGQYDLEKAKLLAGSGKTLDVLTAFSGLATARGGLALAKSNYYLAVLNLYNVMGL